MNVDDDLSLIRRCTEGNPRAFEQVVDRFHKPIFAFAFKFLQNADDAEDVTQTVFIKVFENLSSYDSKYKLFSWIYKIAVNEAINFRNSRRTSEELGENVVSREHTPEKIYLDNELHQQIMSALDSMKSDYSMVIVLRHFQNCSYQEMSEILDIPVKTVKSRLFSARQELKERMVRVQHD